MSNNNYPNLSTPPNSPRIGQNPRTQHSPKRNNGGRDNREERKRPVDEPRKPKLKAQS